MASRNDDDDEFWSLAMLPPTDVNSTNCATNGDEAVSEGLYNNQIDQDEEISIIQSFSICPTDPSQDPLNLNLRMNCNDGILSDVSGIPWDAALLLSGFLYGTNEGRQLCYDACFGDDCDGGILELGSGLGIVGMAAVAAASSVHNNLQINGDDTRCNGKSYREELQIKKKVGAYNNTSRRVVLTDLNDTEILSHLRKNIDANLDRIIDASQRNKSKVSNSTCQPDCKSQSNINRVSKTMIGNLELSVAPCDWIDVSNALEVNSSRKSTETNTGHSSIEQMPSGPFNLIIGSALIYLPEHASACADTLFYYLSGVKKDNLNITGLEESPKRQAVILQLPDRAGFTTHFLPRCLDLGLRVLCHELDKELVEKVQQGWSRRIPSASDYRLYFISMR